MGPDEQKAALTVLTEMLQDKEAAAREQAAVVLGWVGPEAETVIPALTKALQDGHHEVRKAAAEALERIKRK
jgi:HEAT repeat protein